MPNVHLIGYHGYGSWVFSLCSSMTYAADDFQMHNAIYICDHLQILVLLHMLCYAVLSHFSCVRLFATLWTIACQAPLSMRILQSRILGWIACRPPRESSKLRDQTHISCLLHWQAGSLPLAPPGKPSCYINIFKWIVDAYCYTQF